MRFFLIFSFLLFFATANADDGRNYRFSIVSPSQGLPNSLVHCIIQANNGFLWVGTNNGLARFDGFEFKVYQPEPFNIQSIAHKSIEYIVEDDSGKLWLLFPSKNIDCFDPKTGKIIHYPGYSTSMASADRKSTNIAYKDKLGNIWFASNYGVSAYIKKTNSFKYFNNYKKIRIGKTYSISSDKDNNIYFASEDGLFVINQNTYLVSQLGFKSSLDSVPISDVKTDNKNHLWVTTYRNGFFCIDLAKNVLVNTSKSIADSSYYSIFQSINGDIYLLSQNPENKLLYFANHEKYSGTGVSFYFEKSYMAEFFSFAEDATHNIWFSGSSGLYKFNPKLKEVTAFKNDPTVPGTLSENETGPLYIDKTNVLWVGIYKVGLNKLDLNQKPFYFITKNSAASPDIPDNNILSILEDHLGNLWMASYGSGLLIRPKTKNVYDKMLNDKSINDKSFKYISAMVQDKNKNIWAGSYYTGLFIIQPQTKTVKILNSKSNPSFKASIIRKIITDRQGNLWFATTSHGLVEYNFEKKDFIYHSENNDKNYLDYGFYRTCFEDSRDRIWVGTQSGGILIFNKQGQLLKHIVHGTNNTAGLISNTVYSFYEDLNGLMWIGTSAGLESYNEAIGEFNHYTTKEGLCSNTVYSIMPDSLNNLWMNTDYGLSQFNTKSETFKNYYQSDGLISHDFNSTAAYKGNDNTLYYGTSKGILYFKPSEIKDNPYPSEPVITGLKIFNKEINPGEKLNNRIIIDNEIIYCKKISLTHKEYLFSIAFTTLNYSSTAKVKFKYRLEPFDKGWYLTDASQRWVNYSNLDAGTYTFKVKASSSDGEWLDNANEASLIIEILPPFWKTWWFRGIILLVLTGGTLIIYFSRIRRLELNQKKLEILVANRTRMWEENNMALEMQKQEIVQQKEKLEFNNKLLREQQDRILHQNIELDTHRHHLEQMVEERTSELKESREKAEEASRLKSAFLANMSHEIRTPMNAIVGFSNLISSNEYTDEQKKDFINIIKKNSESLLIIIDDILDLSKIQSKQLMIVPRIFQLNNFLLDIYRTFQVAVQAKKLELHIDLQLIDDRNDLCTDPVRLKQVFVNLINNAIKFTDEGSITFGVHQINFENVDFYVKDTGYGISPEWHEAIFERFIKVSARIGENHTGAGLGLAISKSLIELLGGKIWFESEINKGTCFYFRIPLNISNHDVKTEKTVINVQNLDSILKGKVVLIVEDEEANYKVLNAFLKIKQVTTVYVVNGLEAVELLKENASFDAVLMDIRMPVMDGTTALKLIREINPKIPIIAETAYATIEERAEYEALGFDHYLVKPISQQELYHALYSVFTRK